MQSSTRRSRSAAPAGTSSAGRTAVAAVPKSSPRPLPRRLLPAADTTPAAEGGMRRRALVSSPARGSSPVAPPRPLLLRPAARAPDGLRTSRASDPAPAGSSHAPPLPRPGAGSAAKLSSVPQALFPRGTIVAQVLTMDVCPQSQTMIFGIA